MKDGIFQEGNKFKVYVDGSLIKSARMKEHAENAYSKAKKSSNATSMQVSNETSVDLVVAMPTQKREPVFATYIPEKDPDFIPFGEFSEINTIVKSRMFYPVFITGPTGNGKSTMVEQACARNKRQFIRLQINANTDEDQLIGSKTLVDGNIEIVEGPVLIAMRTGAVLSLDELDAADPNNIMCLQSILEGRPYYFKLKNEMIYPAPGFNVFATANTKGRGSESGKYIGTKMLNEAFLERFPVTFEQEYPSQSVELRIIKAAMAKFECVDDEFADILVRWSDAIRRTYEDGALDDLITTRRLLQIVQGFSIFKDKKAAVRLACNRFDSITKNTFIDVFDKMTPDVNPVVDSAEAKSEEIPF